MSNPIVSIHVLRSLPPHCINRDDNGSPKSTVFGGAPRGRVSSQAQKRSWRKSEEMQRAGALAVRSREVESLFAVPLTQQYGHDAEDAWKVVNAFMPLFLSKIADDDRHVASAVLSLAPDEITMTVDGLHDCFELALADLDDKGNPSKSSPLHALKKKLTAAFRDWTTAIDVALLGRMVASNTNLEMLGAVQVGQMISTHTADVQTDYYTALDDLAVNAAMIGRTEYASGVYYQVVNVDLGLLFNNLAGEESIGLRAVKALMRAVALRLPSGRRNGFFAETMPGLMLVEVRTSGPSISMANAFETPVENRKGGLLPASALAMSRHWEYTHRFIGRSDGAWALAGDPLVEDAIQSTNAFDGVQRVASLDALESALDAAIKETL